MPEIYRRIIGKLLYLNLTRHFIQCAAAQSVHAGPKVFTCSHSCSQVPSRNNGLGLYYPANSEMKLTAFCDGVHVLSVPDP